MIKAYRKTSTIKAEQFDGSAEMIDKYKIISTHLACTAGGFEGAYFLSTLEGELRVNIGDWIATGVNGEHWAIADDVFKQTYAELPVIPVFVDKYIKESHGYGSNVYEAVDCAYSLSKNGKNEEAKLGLWIKNNSDTFSRAWLDGYTVED